MATIILGTAPQKVDVPEEDIQEVITSVKGFFAKNTHRTDCGVGIFGHYCYTIRKSNIEEDVREAAKTATTYTKA